MEIHARVFHNSVKILISLQNKQIKNKRLPFSNNIPQIKIKTHLTPYISKIYVI
jgi:hypothetical protein